MNVIVDSDVWRRRFRLREPYSIAGETFHDAENIFLRLIPSTGHPGVGVAAPEPGVTGETADRVETALKAVGDALVRLDAHRPMVLVGAVREQLGDLPAARAAVEMAAWALLAHHARLPVWRLLGGYRDSFVTSVTVGILPEDETVSRARDLIDQGFVALKLKGGLDGEQDALRVLRVREAVGPDVELRFDANQGYSAEQAIAFAEAVTGANISILEQPTRRGQPDVLARVSDAAEQAVMADESLVTLADAHRLIGGRRVDMVNLKLMKHGGLFRAGIVDGMAQAAGMESMVGCMDECALGIAAGLAFALSRPNVTAVDLDGHLDLIGDPSADCVTFRDGRLYPSEHPGWGWRRG